jgi:hypothetical protein
MVPGSPAGLFAQAGIFGVIKGPPIRFSAQRLGVGERIGIGIEPGQAIGVGYDVPVPTGLLGKV